MKTRTETLIARAQANGSTATTLKGAVKFCVTNKLTGINTKPAASLARVNLDRLKVGDMIQLDSGLRYGFSFRSREDASAKAKAAEEIGTCGQRSNYSTGTAKIYGPAAQARWEKIHYRGRYKGYAGSYLYQDYQSCLAVSKSGRSVMVITSCVLRRRVIAPCGTKFATDSNGVLVQRLSDGMDFHPIDWMSSSFATDVRTALAENFKRRQADRRAAKLVQREMQIYNHEIGSVRVTLDDSRRAGNCVEGSLNYCATRLGITREEVLNGSYLFSVPARRLLASNGHDGVNRAVRQAWLRETTVTI